MQSEDELAQQRAVMIAGGGGRSPPGTGRAVGIVYGGVLGGLVGLALIILIIYILWNRFSAKGTGCWRWWKQGPECI